MIPQEFIDHALGCKSYNVGVYQVIHNRHDPQAVTLVKRVAADNDVGFGQQYAAFMNPHLGGVSDWMFNTTNSYDWLNEFLYCVKIPLEIYSYSSFKNPWDQYRINNSVNNYTLAQLVAYTGAE